MPAVQQGSSGGAARIGPSSSVASVHRDRGKDIKVQNGNQMEYSVVYCSSEDPDHPVSELLVHSSNTSGWQSGRFCDFPQDIIIQFDQPVHLSQIQFLSHQSKISSKLELFTAGHDPQVHNHSDAKFTRLGYLSLDSNERSHFQARELKSVYVDVPVSYVKISLHKCYINKFNLVNQVGLVALNCIGHRLTVSDFSSPTTAEQSSSNVLMQSAAHFAQPKAAEHDAHVAPHSSSKATDATSTHLKNSARQLMGDGVLTADHYEFDQQTAEQIQMLTSAKQRAVEFEDYEEAKRCKDMIDKLRVAGSALKELEHRKRLAVSNEDFDQAKAIKTEMDRLRLSVEARSDDIHQLQTASPKTIDCPKIISSIRQPHRVIVEPDELQQPAVRTSGVSAVVPAAVCVQDDPIASVMSSQDDVALPAAARSIVAATVPQSMVSHHHQPLNVDDMPATASGGYNYVPAGLQEYPPGQGPPDWYFNVDDVRQGNADGFHGGSSAEIGDEIETFHDGTHHPLSGIQTNILELETPEYLSAGHAKEAIPVVQVFGEYLARCLWSKSWNLRDAALQKIQLELDQSNHDQGVRELVQVISLVLKRGVGDKIANVFLTSSLLLQYCVGSIFVHEDLGRPDVQAALDPVVPLVVARLSDSHPKIRGAVGESLMGLCRCPSIGSQYILQFVLRLPKKKNPNARLVCCRIYFLAALVEEQGLQGENDAKDSIGVPLEPIIELACEHVEHPVQNVRGAIVALISSCYHIVGYRRIEPLLVNLRPAQRDVFEKAFEDKGCQISGGHLEKHDFMFEAPRSNVFNDDSSSCVQSNEAAACVKVTQSESASLSRSTNVPPVDVPESIQTVYPLHTSSRILTARDHNEQVTNDKAPDGVPFTCVFCQEQDPGFSPEGLDVHYWQQCPMLMECQGCSQVVEIRWLEEHRRDECDTPVGHDELQISESQCPLCRETICSPDDPAADQLWRDHLTSQCLENPRLSIDP